MNSKKSYIVHREKFDIYYYDARSLVYNIPFQVIHREDGPAVLHKDGTLEWWLHGKKLNCSTQKEFESRMNLKAFW